MAQLLYDDGSVSCTLCRALPFGLSCFAECICLSPPGYAVCSAPMHSTMSDSADDGLLTPPFPPNLGHA